MNYAQKIKVLLLGGACMAGVKATQATSIKVISAPVAVKKNKRFTKFGDVRIDPYFWMRERENPEVTEHLNKENAFTQAVLAPVAKIQAEAFAKLRSRVNEGDSTYPYKDGNYFYYIRYEEGKEYPFYARKKGSREGKEEILLDVNEEAKKHKYYSSHVVETSSDQKTMVVATDTMGRRFYNLSVIDIASKKLLFPVIEQVTGDVVLSDDQKSLFYTKQAPTTLRVDRLYRYDIQSGTTHLVMQEKDEAFGIYIGKFRSKRFITIKVAASQENETWLIPSNDSLQVPKLVLKREKNHEYTLEDGLDKFFILSNKGAKNFALYECPEQKFQRKNWVPLIRHRKDTLIEDFDVFSDFLVVEERSKGLHALRVWDRKTAKSELISFPDKVYVVASSTNLEYQTQEFFYSYESLARPPSVYLFDRLTHLSTAVKVKQVPNFKTEDYETDRIFVAAKDGTKIPVSLVFKAGQAKSKSPVLITGYGSYGVSSDADFSTYPLSYVDEGFVYAIAHVRGGTDMGREWYDQGRLKNKINTFSDFNSVAEALVKKGWAAKGHVYAQGGSAGGLLVGAIANMRPDLYRGLVAEVPFVDVLTTMLDDSIPLTTGEYDEWGNPNKKSYYNYMKRYSPYDQVKARAYPHILVTAGLHDSQVQYWEPMKWTAKLREHNTSKSLILMHTEMEAGHSGTTGRYQALKESARVIAFILGIEKELLP